MLSIGFNFWTFKRIAILDFVDVTMFGAIYHNSIKDSFFKNIHLMLERTKVCI